MQQAMLLAAPVAGLKQHGMNGPVAAKAVQASVALSAVKVVGKPMA